ncbi:hypothetical protein ABZ345_43765 [Lentzea sp. NPDC005914]|uniref:hypothetical protein n=1 Tax=Lentzea sp. NPDC005914 TaxID=3154572 RepID=UPI0033CBEAF9
MPQLAEVLAVWTERTPRATATDAELAEWFALKAELLAVITCNPDHPEFDQARHFARKAEQSANHLRSKENES